MATNEGSGVSGVRLGREFEWIPMRGNDQVARDLYERLYERLRVMDEEFEARKREYFAKKQAFALTKWCMTCKKPHYTRECPRLERNHLDKKKDAEACEESMEEELIQEDVLDKQDKEACDEPMVEEPIQEDVLEEQDKMVKEVHVEHPPKEEGDSKVVLVLDTNIVNPYEKDSPRMKPNRRRVKGIEKAQYSSIMERRKCLPIQDISDNVRRRGRRRNGWGRMSRADSLKYYETTGTCHFARKW